jgi:soluble lytic murein transglycosylase-like protein
VQQQPGEAESQRLRLLREAVAVHRADPGHAAELCARAGPGAALERVRLQLWLDALRRSSAAPGGWKQLREQALPDDLQASAELGLARALVQHGEVSRAREILHALAVDGNSDADEELLDLTSGEMQRAAAQRLAVSAPQRLRRVARDLERSVLSDLDAERWLARAAAWRRSGLPRQAAAELSRQRFRGADEARRRIELARAEIAAGRSSRALRVLPAGTDAGPEVAVLRAEAHRRIAWSRHPRSSATAPFRDCLSWARRGTAGSDLRVAKSAWALVVECGTEAGRLDLALSAWWRWHALEPGAARRQWIGRRLGVALATGTADPSELQALAGSLPLHARCLAYWGDRSGDRLPGLAEVVIADMYGQWARERLGRAGPRGLELAAAVAPGAPPPAVQWLLDATEPGLAAREWRRTRLLRGTSPAEALAAARLEWSHGHANRAIRWLLAGDPDLGTVRMDRASISLVRQYLPLRWEEELKTAAREAGVDPWLLAGLARQESVFSARAVSPRGARGVLQLLTGTARPHAVALGLGRSPDLYDPEVNLRIGAREVARLQRRFGAIEPALAAYNAGETRARRWWRQWPDRQRFTEAVPIPETYTYIRRVMFLAEAYRLVYADTWREP